MRRSRILCLAVLCALLCSTVAPRAFASWECEGRTCGTMLLFCCCVGPDAARDSNCGRAGGDAAVGETVGACPAACNCVLTVEAADATGPAPGTHGIAAGFHPALLPSPPLAPAPLPSETPVRLSETRGPPLPAICLTTPSLRGPPAPAFPIIGS